MAIVSRILRQLGSTGLNVSQLGMGTIRITRLEWMQSIRVVREVIDPGINWSDTARLYWDSELRLGNALNGGRLLTVKVNLSITAGNEGFPLRYYLLRQID